MYMGLDGVEVARTYKAQLLTRITGRKDTHRQYPSMGCSCLLDGQEFNCISHLCGRFHLGRRKGSFTVIFRLSLA
jgi:hypothetical protein